MDGSYQTGHFAQQRKVLERTNGDDRLVIALVTAGAFIWVTLGALWLAGLFHPAAWIAKHLWLGE